MIAVSLGQPLPRAHIHQAPVMVQIQPCKRMARPQILPCSAVTGSFYLMFSNNLSPRALTRWATVSLLLWKIQSLAAEQGTLNCIILRLGTAPFTCGADLILKPEMGPFISGQQQDTFLEHQCQMTVEVSKCRQQGTGTMRGQRIWGASKVVNKDLCFPN